MPFLRAALIAHKRQPEMKKPVKAKMQIRTAEDLFIRNTVNDLIRFDDMLTAREITRLGV